MNTLNTNQFQVLISTTSEEISGLASKLRVFFSHPSESYLLKEGCLTKANGTAYANADDVSLRDNALMHLFKSINPQPDGVELAGCRPADW